jgi:trans-aconitate methyltransferase
MQHTWDASLYASNGRFVALMAESLVELLHPQPGERILDLGCGDGVLTRRIAESGATVIGVDASPHMIAAARKHGVDAHLLDGESLSFANEFDAVFSNAALHWMKNQESMLAGVYRALKPGGRFVAECGGQGNVAAIRVALLAVLRELGIAPEQIEHNHFYTPVEYRRLLEAQHFIVEDIRLTPRPTPLPSGMADWLHTFRRGLFHQLPEDDRAAAIDETVKLLRPVLCDSAGNWTADYVRLRFVATKSSK